ncbi:MAG: UBP-type zinc finger domain-containing protein [Ilumatobacteraceae bacterium]
MSDGACGHLDTIVVDGANSTGCEDCLAIGSHWLHLRRCTECGHVGCCDSSPNRHATAHFRKTGHPIVQSFEPGEEWLWCYVDEIGFEFDTDVRSPAHP